MQPKLCLITGANSGIGKATAIGLAKMGHHVLLGCRSKTRGEQALQEIQEAAKSARVELIEIDLSLKKSIAQAAQQMNSKYTQLDVLIHNAADFDVSRKQVKQTPEGVESVWATNHIGPVYLTSLLLDLIKKSPQGRILTVASKGLLLHPNLKVNLLDPEFKLRPFRVSSAYYQSKLAQVMYTFWLAKQLDKTSVTVNCIRVTNVKIDLDRYLGLTEFQKWMYSIKSRFSISPEEMAKTYIYLATSAELSKTTGMYFSEKNTAVRAPAYSKNTQNVEDLMQLTLRYV